MWCCYEYIYMLKNTCTFNPSKTSYFSHFDNHIIDYIIFNIIQNLTNKIFLFISKLTNEFAEHITFLVDTKSVPNSLPDKNINIYGLYRTTRGCVPDRGTSNYKVRK